MWIADGKLKGGSEPMTTELSHASDPRPAFYSDSPSHALPRLRAGMDHLEPRLQHRHGPEASTPPHDGPQPGDPASRAPRRQAAVRIARGCPRPELLRG